MHKPMRTTYSRREMEAMGEPVGMPNRGPAFGEYLDPVTAVIGSAVIGAGASIIGGNKAAKSQQHATDSANELQQYMYDTTRQDNLPALESRNWALEQLKSRLSGGQYNPNLTASQVMSEPGYQFGLNQGLSSMNNQLTARGMRNSGAALMAATRYGNDYATSKFDNAFQRLQTQQNNDFNRYSTLAGLGSAGAQTIAGAGQNYAGQVGANNMALGNALGAQSIATGNALAGAANNIGGWYANQQSQIPANPFMGNGMLTSYGN